MFDNILDRITKNEKLKKTLTSLGEDNKATYSAIIISAAKGIFRPIFTMMDKKEDERTKKYTALREGLTELLAIPIYWICGEVLSKKLAEKIETRPEKLPIVKANMRFLGVCVAALVIIPGVCSCVVKPFTSMMFKDNKSKTEKNSNNTLDITEGEANTQEIKFGNLPKVNNNQIYNFQYQNNTYANSGMRV